VGNAQLSKRDIEADATEILRRFYPRLLRSPGLFPVQEFFDHVLPDAYGLDTGVEVLSDGVEGMTWPDGRVLVSPETYLGACRGEGRPRFTMPHESYHGIKHRRQIQRALVDAGELVLYRRRTIEPYRDPEWQANYFAAAVLMPLTIVHELARKQSRELLPLTMARVFKVSWAAARIRLEKLGLLTAN